MPKVTVNNITMHYDQQGTGEPLILIQGRVHEPWGISQPLMPRELIDAVFSSVWAREPSALR